MNREWSEKNKDMQGLLKKATFSEGIALLLALREELMSEILSWSKELNDDAFSAIPFINAKGYHSKTIAYSLWHIFRIEDIVVNSLIQDREQVLFSGGFDKKTKSPIITTGNELIKEQIADFSRQLDISALYEYIGAVKESTDGWLKEIGYSDLKRRFSEEDKERLLTLSAVSKDENALWLIDYWCGKDVKGLILMPLSRHWIMHIEAALRIKEKIAKA